MVRRRVLGALVVLVLTTVHAGDPTCIRGLANDAHTACCPAKCTRCGGAGCELLPGGASNCCTSGVLAMNRNCNVVEAPCTLQAGATAAPTTAPPSTAKPTTAIPVTAPPTTSKPSTQKPTTPKPTTAKPATAPPTTAGASAPDPLCLLGTPNVSRQVCCPKDVCGGKCAGDGCSLLPGGWEKCCLNGVLATYNVSCALQGAPCVIPATPKPTAAPTTAKPTTAAPTATPKPTVKPTAVPTAPPPSSGTGDPNCDRGVLNPLKTVCCSLAACGGQCGGAGCDALPGGYYSCCLGGVKSLNRSCLTAEAPCTMPPTPAPTSPPPTAKPTTAPPTQAPTTKAPTQTPQPTAAGNAPDPLCLLGVKNAAGTACCPKTLCNGQCGGAGCDALPGGSASCCSTNVLAAGKSCASQGAPCVIGATPSPAPATSPPTSTSTAVTTLSDPWCLAGIPHPNGTQCCHYKCTTCGKSNCAQDPMGASNCCSSGIAATGRKCDLTVAPCTLSANPAVTVDPATIKRATSIGVLPGTAMSIWQREAAYQMQFDNILLYMPVQGLNWSWVASFLNKGRDVQLVIEFMDSEPNLAMVAAGKYDSYLLKFADAAVADGRHITVRPLHEFNGDWYPWGIFLPGNTREDFKAAFRHVVTLFKSKKAPFSYQLSYNVKNAAGDATKFVDFYPGDAYCDMICVSAYNMCGARYTDNKSFAEVFGYAYAQLTSFTTKPLCLAETSTTSWCGGKPMWYTNAWSSLAYQFTRVTSINWFFENKITSVNVDWDLNTPEDVKAWMDGLRSFRAATTVA